MKFTYTVRPMGNRVYHPFVPGRSVYEITGAGAVVTIREEYTNKVVKQFPRVSTEAEGHKVAQHWLKENT
jgi:hypothetical protein